MRSSDLSPATAVTPDGEQAGGYDPEQLDPGAVAGPYIVVRCIAKGGGGAVYEARHAFLQRRAALKVLHRAFLSSAEMLERFVREARAVNSIAHPNVVEIFDFGRLNDGRPYHVMRYIEGLPLHAFVRSRGMLSPHEVLDIVAPIAEALAAAHAHEIVHRDLHPGNVLIGSGGVPYLLDFGIAKVLDATVPITASGRLLGTPVAMAPEQILNRPVDGRTDIYALGVLIHFALSGRYPFEAASDQETLRKQVESVPPAVSRLAPVPPAIDAVIRRCLAKLPRDRYERVGLVVDAMRSALQETSSLNLRNTEGFAVHVEIRRSEQDKDVGSTELGDVLRVLGRAEEELAHRGFSFPRRTARSLLGTLVLGGAPAMRDSAHEGGLELARELADKLARREMAHSNLRIFVAVRRGPAISRLLNDAEEIVGGDLLEGEWWAGGRAAVPQVYVTPTLLCA
jgi:serine/threonine-protein kinase